MKKEKGKIIAIAFISRIGLSTGPWIQSTEVESRIFFFFRSDVESQI